MGLGGRGNSGGAKHPCTGFLGRLMHFRNGIASHLIGPSMRKARLMGNAATVPSRPAPPFPLGRSLVAHHGHRIGQHEPFQARRLISYQTTTRRTTLKTMKLSHERTPVSALCPHISAKDDGAADVPPPRSWSEVSRLGRFGIQRAC